VVEAITEGTVLNIAKLANSVTEGVAGHAASTSCGSIRAGGAVGDSTSIALPVAYLITTFAASTGRC
jgi:hypothetical protein